MAEEEVNYASVVFKSNKCPPTKARKEEETVYAEVKVRNKTNEPTADTNAEFLLGNKANSRRLQYQRLACCLGILCVILLLVIIAVVIYHLATLSHQSDESELMAANHNLTNLNNISLYIEKLRRDNNNLTVQLGNLTQNYTVLESKITDLTADVQNLTTQNQNLTTRNQDLTTQNQDLTTRNQDLTTRNQDLTTRNQDLTAVIQQLETQRNNLTKRIQDMKTNWNKLNVSRAQWSIDAYCPTVNKGRQCKACQKGFGLSRSNCYSYYNVPLSERKTWEEAQQVCRGRSSDLVVVHSQEEQNELNTNSVGSSGTDGYWFGLRAEGGRWKWIDGSNLTESDWTQQPPPPPADGQCVISVQNNNWRSVRCDQKQRWICKMKALSV